MLRRAGCGGGGRAVDGLVTRARHARGIAAGARRRRSCMRRCAPWLVKRAAGARAGGRPRAVHASRRPRRSSCTAAPPQAPPPCRSPSCATGSGLTEVRRLNVPLFAPTLEPSAGCGPAEATSLDGGVTTNRRPLQEKRALAAPRAAAQAARRAAPLLSRGVLRSRYRRHRLHPAESSGRTSRTSLALTGPLKAATSGLARDPRAPWRRTMPCGTRVCATPGGGGRHGDTRGRSPRALPSGTHEPARRGRSLRGELGDRRAL